MKVKIDGYSTITGTPEAILQVMQDARYMPMPGDYIEGVQEAVHRFFDIDLQVEGNTQAERAESFLREMAKANMLTIEEEN